MKRKITVLVCSILAFVLSFSCVMISNCQIAEAASMASISMSGTQDYDKAAKILEKVNKERTKKGLNKLKMDKSLTNAAMTRALEVLFYRPQTSPHLRPNGKKVKTLNKRIDYENAMEWYWMDMTASQIVKDWMASSAHKKGILLKNAKSIGISCVTTLNGCASTLEISTSKVKEAAPKTGEKTFTRTFKSKNTYIKKSYFSVEPEYLLDMMSVGNDEQLYVFYESKYGLAIINQSSFNWSSSDEEIATVSKDGVVKPLKTGTVKITMKLKSDSSIKKTVTCTIED